MKFTRSCYDSLTWNTGQCVRASKVKSLIIKRWKLIWFGNVTRHLRRRCRESGLKEDFGLSVEGTVDGDGE